MIKFRSADIEISKIKRDTRLRQLNLAWVDALSVSIKKDGLQQPAVLLEYKKELYLGAGGHRIAAFEKLNLTVIPSRIKIGETDNPILEAQLLEIDENLFRNPLKGLDRMRNLATRKKLYEEVYPQTKAGVAGANAKHGHANEILSFAEETAEKIGLGKRTVELDISIFNALSEDTIARVDGTEIAQKTSDLRKLGDNIHGMQKRILDLVLGDEPECQTIGEAIEKLQGIRKPSPSDKMYRSTVGTLNRMTPGSRADVFLIYRDEIIKHFKKEGVL
ncbi:MAG: ParB/RepB/Spo0J family partition protein [Rhizobiaceae bacterium]